MNTTKATPGPWRLGHVRRAEYPGIEMYEQTVHAGDGNALAVVALGGPGATDARKEAVAANARMIAAAPELRDAVEVLEAPPQRTATKAVMVAWFVRYSQILNRARAALAKVEGK